MQNKINETLEKEYEDVHKQIAIEDDLAGASAYFEAQELFDKIRQERGEYYAQPFIEGFVRGITFAEEKENRRCQSISQKYQAVMKKYPDFFPPTTLEQS